MADKLQDVLASIIERLENGAAPWRQPWANGATPSCPLRADGQSFSGSNAMLLAMIGAGRGCSSPYWLTFQQCLKLEACVRKGSKGAPAILFKTRLVEDEQGEDDRLLKYLKSYVVFNADDVDGLPDSFSTAPKPDPALQAAARDAVIDAIPADVRHGGSRAYYSRVGDFIQLPHVEAFETLDDYRSTRCHEAGHWTGAEHRLNREFGKKFGDQAYAFEELCAEMAACLLGMEIGVRPQMLDSTPLISRTGPRSSRTGQMPWSRRPGTHSALRTTSWRSAARAATRRPRLRQRQRGWRPDPPSLKDTGPRQQRGPSSREPLRLAERRP